MRPSTPLFGSGLQAAWIDRQDALRAVADNAGGAVELGWDAYQRAAIKTAGQVRQLGSAGRELLRNVLDTAAAPGASTPPRPRPPPQLQDAAAACAQSAGWLLLYTTAALPLLAVGGLTAAAACIVAITLGQDGLARFATSLLNLASALCANETTRR